MGRTRTAAAADRFGVVPSGDLARSWRNVPRYPENVRWRTSASATAPLQAVRRADSEAVTSTSRIYSFATEALIRRPVDMRVVITG